MPGRRQSIGKEGERLAVDYLIEAGYTIETLNYRCPLGEIDIIARERDVLAFIEVKARKSDLFGSAREAVDLRKQKRLGMIALYYLNSLKRGRKEEMCRFDVVSLTKDQQSLWRIELIRDAFPLLSENF